MNNYERNNPLYGVTIGAIIYALTGKFKSSEVKAPVSLMIAQEESQKYMSGESSYVFSEKMNQGSFGLSGSYGVSGVSLLKSSLSAYVGKSSAASTKSVTVNYNAISVAGIEYINFGDLTTAEFIASLSNSCQQSITSVLEAYNAVKAEASKSELNVLNVLQNDDVQGKPLRDLVRKWISASEEFTNNFGDGLVVGVAWGAFGGVNMVMTSETESKSWNYGGQADFSYANTFASVAVKATYDGSQSSGEAKVKVNCSSYLSGSVLSNQISEWFSKVSDKTFADLADVNVMDKAPNMNINHGAPSIPDFVQPIPEKDIVEKMEQIKNLDDLDALAKASAYEKTKISNPKLTFDEFINHADKPANKEKLDEFKNKIINNEIDTLGFLANKQKNNTEKIEERYGGAMGSGKSFLSSQAQAQAFNVEIKNQEYVPLGVWITNWQDLFPWMAQGYYNSIDGIDGEDVVKARVMLQDYQTLSRMYYIAHSSGITEFKRKDPSLPVVTSLSIADAFANAAGKIQDVLDDFDQAQISKIYEKLSKASQNIYTMWNTVAFLRSCELGLGLIKDNKTINSPANKGNDNNRQIYSLSNCDFDGENYTAFSRSYKVLPLLTPDGDIWAFGPEKGGLSSIYENEVVFSNPGREKYLVFSYSKEDKILSNSDNRIKLYPIPFSAAQGISWKGMSFSTNIGSINSLNQNLESLSEQLGKLNAWSFSSKNWSKNWNAKYVYRQRNIKKQYIGLIDEIENVF